MIKTSTNNQINDRAGLLSIFIGLILGRYMMIRPNRIENGALLNFINALESTAVLFGAVFVVMLIVIYMIRTDRTDKKWLLLPSVILTFAVFILATGLSASHHIVGMGSSARASLGSSFWLMFAGFLLLMLHAIKVNPRPQLARFIFLISVILIIGLGYSSGLLKDISILKELNSKSDRIWDEMVRHLQLAVYSTLTGLVLSLSLAYRAYRNPIWENSIKTFVNIAQVIPTLSFLGLIMIPLTALSNSFPWLKTIGISGIGFFPAYIVLTMYTLLPMTNNILAGLKSINKDILQAAAGMGMSRKQQLFQVELPLSTPAIYSGFRTALVQAVGNTILAGLVGGGGIGSILFLGLAQSAPDLVVISALLVVSIAFSLNTGLSVFESLLRKRITGEVTHD